MSEQYVVSRGQVVLNNKTTKQNQKTFPRQLLERRLVCTLVRFSKSIETFS